MTDIEPRPNRRYTRAQAAELCGISQDTIRRRQRDGLLPGARMRPDGMWDYPLQDLVDAGLYGDERSRRGGRPHAASRQTRATEADRRAEELAARVTELEEEVRFLRSALAEALAALAARRTS